jgi:hypothetical protein
MHRKSAGSANHHQNNGKNDGADQTRQEEGAAKRRIENNLAAAGFFSRIWLLIRDAAPLRDSRFERRVGSAIHSRLLLKFRKPKQRTVHSGRI